MVPALDPRKPIIHRYQPVPYRIVAPEHLFPLGAPCAAALRERGFLKPSD